jgi:hypothetical protein
VNGNELNFVSLLRNFKIYIQGEVLLPVILVRNQIGDMLGGERGKFTCRKNKVTFGLSIQYTQYTLIQCAGADFKVTGIKFMAVFAMRSALN